ncbi:hypothetical protein BH11ACT8_BH11ACT8_00290 [soil metagenome]
MSRISTPFGFSSTAGDVTAGIDMSGKRVVVTGPYDAIVAYGQSKSATALLAVGATRRWAADGITANAVMPGAIATNLQRHTGGLRTPIERRKSHEQGASTTLLAATSPLLKGIGGRYLEDNSEAFPVTRRSASLTGVARYALDTANADRLWDLSLELLS